MVYRYQNALREDDELRKRLQFLRPVPRRVLPIALGCLCVGLVLLGRLDGGIGGYMFVFSGCLVGFLFAARFLKEHTVIRHWRAAVGTVLLFQKSGHSRRRIKYGFMGSDGIVNLGRAKGSARLPKEGATLGIDYRSDNPSRSLLLSQFLFDEFSEVRVLERTEPSEFQRTES